MATDIRFNLSRVLLRFSALAVVCYLLCGCLTRTRELEYKTSTAELQSATLAELVERINHSADEIKTLNATVDIAASTGGQKKGKITDYTEIHGYVLVREPDMLRVIGLMPVVRNTLFDMVSDGVGFQLLVPAKNKVIIGKNKITKPSTHELENLRPDAFFDSLLLHAIGPDEIPFLRVGLQKVRDPKTKKEVEQSNYIVSILHRKPDNDKEWYIARSVFFDRVSLQLYKQEVFDELGQTITEANYSNFQNYSGVMYPALIDVKRPLDEYEIRLTIDKLDINKVLTDKQFELHVPPDTMVQRLDDNPAERDQAQIGR